MGFPAKWSDERRTLEARKRTLLRKATTASSSPQTLGGRNRKKRPAVSLPKVEIGQADA